MRHRLLAYWCRRLLALLLLGSLFAGGTSVQNAEDSLEYSVKGAFLFKFGAFVEWPPSVFPDPGAPFVIGILGEDPFGANLDEIVQNRTVHGRRVLIKRFKRLDQAAGAHILYISRSEMERLEQIVANLRGTNVLTVTDESPGAAGIINFVIQEKKVRFEIDPEAADRAGLRVSSKLLSLAKVVDNDKRWMRK